MKKLALLLPALSLAACTTPQQVTHTHSEDCQVIGAIAHGQWLSGSLSAPMRAKSFGADCDWKALGMPRPAITNEDRPVLSFSYSPPVYSADGKQATVNWSYGGDESAKGRPQSYFYTGSKCTAEKHGRQWQFVTCKMSFIT